MLQNELPALVSGRLELSDDNPPTIIIDQVQRLDGMLEGKNSSVVIRLPTAESAELFQGILDVINGHSGDSEVLLEIRVERDLLVRVRANPALRVDRSKALDVAMQKLGCSVLIESRTLARPV